VILAQFLGVALSAADICQMPSFDPDVVGGKPFCVIEEEQEVETPYFLVTISPHVLVWLYDDGRTLSIESSVHQSQISLSITVQEVEPNDAPNTMQAYGCPDVEIRSGLRALCDQSVGDFVSRSYAILKGTRLISIGLSAGSLAKQELSNYERIVNSIEPAP
jgi:hypothetical protein